MACCRGQRWQDFAIEKNHKKRTKKTDILEQVALTLDSLPSYNPSLCLKMWPLHLESTVQREAAESASLKVNISKSELEDLLWAKNRNINRISLKSTQKGAPVSESCSKSFCSISYYQTSASFLEETFDFKPTENPSRSLLDEGCSKEEKLARVRFLAVQEPPARNGGQVASRRRERILCALILPLVFKDVTVPSGVRR